MGPHASLDLLVCLHVFLLVHRLRAPRWPCSCYRQRTQPRDRKEDWHSASDDGDQLVHVSNCVLVPNAWHFSCEGRGIHPAGLLRFRHHFQVSTCSQCLAFQLRRPWYPSSWVIALPTSFPSAESASLSTRSLTRSLASSISCSEHVHGPARLAPLR